MSGSRTHAEMGPSLWGPGMSRGLGSSGEHGAGGASGPSPRSRAPAGPRSRVSPFGGRRRWRPGPPSFHTGAPSNFPPDDVTVAARTHRDFQCDSDKRLAHQAPSTKLAFCFLSWKVFGENDRRRRGWRRCSLLCGGENVAFHTAALPLGLCVHGTGPAQLGASTVRQTLQMGEGGHATGVLPGDWGHSAPEATQPVFPGPCLQPASRPGLACGPEGGGAWLPPPPGQ